jgi:tetratricopeptide (TPR) repeat protein
MKNRVFVLFHFVLQMAATSAFAQGLDAETGFIYVKAEYLFETGRYDEAITSYNDVISRDSMYKDALIHRGQAKFALAAYLGAKNDALRSIELKGISPEAAALLGRSFAASRQYKAAINSFSAAIGLDSKKVDYVEWRAESFELDGQHAKACKDYEVAMTMGSATGEMKSKSLCGIKSTPQAPKRTNTPPVNDVPANQNEDAIPVQPETSPGTNPMQNNNQTVPDNQPANENQAENTPGETVIEDSEPAVDLSLPAEDYTINKVEIDEDLFIEISGQGLGKRIIKEVPSIIILPDEPGKVTVNFCVNREGRVISTEYNAQLSTINKKSLVTFAIRKAGEFEFSPGNYDSQCGIMVFHILNK